MTTLIKLTATLVEKKCLHQVARKSLTKELKKGFLKKLTHLFMNEQFIESIGDIRICKSLKVLYLQKNSIKKIENLNFAVNLTHLYLQHNELSKIENLDCLINLKKLYLGYNNISVVEGLKNLTNLTELHIEKQRLRSGEKLSFEPRTTKTLSDGLTYLNVSGNKLTSLEDLKNFRKLIILEAKDNQISSIEKLTDTIASMVRLKNVSIYGNPVTQVYNYKENLIANSDVLDMIDDKPVSEYSRTFLQNFKIEKIQHHLCQKKLEPVLSDDITSSLNLPPPFRDTVSRAMMDDINSRFTFPTILLADENSRQPQTLSTWKSESTGKRNNRIIPRPFWKNVEKQQRSHKNHLYKPNTSFSTISAVDFLNNA